jgi:hypothetical protein
MFDRIALIGGGLLALSATDAQAYIDPGSGMLVWQGLLAVVGAGLVFLGRIARAAKRWWARLRGRDEGS